MTVDFSSFRQTNLFTIQSGIIQRELSFMGETWDGLINGIGTSGLFWEENELNS